MPGLRAALGCERHCHEGLAKGVTFVISILLAADISQETGPFGPTSTGQSPGEPLGEGREGVRELEAGSLSSKNSGGDSPIWKSKRGAAVQLVALHSKPGALRTSLCSPEGKAPVPSSGLAAPQGSPARAGPCLVPETYRLVELITSRVDNQQCHLVMTSTDPEHCLLVVQPLDALTVHGQETVPFLHPCPLSWQPVIHVPQELACHSGTEGRWGDAHRGIQPEGN